jgi:hypothetical protein
LGTGAYIRSGDVVDWRGGLYALQDQLGMSIHVGGRTALELQGRAHSVPLGEKKKVILISDRMEQLPVWFRKHAWQADVEHCCLCLFKNIPQKAYSKLDCGGYTITVSSAERAIMEQIRLTRNNDNIDHTLQLMEGLSTLRPDIIQELLENCRSIKVKRMFLWCAEEMKHAWFERIDISRVDLGKGKRQLYQGGQLNKKYRITVPKREGLPDV